MTTPREVSEVARAARSDRLTLVHTTARRVQRHTARPESLHELLTVLTDEVLAAQLRAVGLTSYYHAVLADLANVALTSVVVPAAVVTAPPRAVALLEQPAAALLGAHAGRARAHARLRLMRLAASMIHDAAIGTDAIGRTQNPRITRYVRVLSPPSCPRCAVIAGRVYSWRASFARHTNCDCTARPLIDGIDEPEPHLLDPLQAYRRGEITGLAAKDHDAIASGTSIVTVLNRRRGAAVATTAGMARSPEAVIASMPSREQALAALTDAGYLTTLVAAA